MKTLCIIAGLVLGAQLALSQSCPQTATIDGLEFQVKQIGNQCFYLDTRPGYLEAALSSVIGQEYEVGNVPLLGSVTIALDNFAVSNYQYQFAFQNCFPSERISANATIGFSGNAPLVGNFTGQIVGNLTIETKYDVVVAMVGGSEVTTIQLNSFDLVQSDLDLQINSSNPVYDALAELLADVFGIDFFVDLLGQPFQDLPSGSPTIRKLNDQVIPLDASIEGPSTICDEPITLTVTAGFAKYLWSTGAQGNSIVVSEPGTYSVTITDNTCLMKTLSRTVTQVKVADFITIEPLCTGKVKLSVEGYSNVRWSTGVESPSIEVGQSGLYSAMATDQSGCEGGDNVNITIGSCQPANTIAAINVVAVCSDVPNLLRRWKITNPNSTPVRMDWEIVGTIQRTWLDVPPGDSYLSTITVPLNQNLLKVYWHNESGQIKSLQQNSISTRCPKTTSSSSIATIGRSATELKIFPNPAKDQFVIEVPSDDERVVPIKILSASGVEWYSGNIQLGIGQNFISNDISTFDNGAYLIKLGNETIRFVKE